MNWAQKIFKADIPENKISVNKYTNEYFKGLEDFKIGKELFRESVQKVPMPPERRKQKITAALEFFDKAIEKGYDKVEVFSFRGMCLRDLNFDLDAIEDFNRCIDKEPGRASFYYDRAITKQYIYDYDGSLSDFNKAIELSKLDNEDTEYWNDYAIKTGYNSGTQKYEQDLNFMMDDKERTERGSRWLEVIEKKKSDIKRRFSN